jgi:hypothetical protein
MKITVYKPLDEECHQMEEFVVDTQTGENKFTGRRFRKAGDFTPTSPDTYRTFMIEVRSTGRFVIYSPKDQKPYAYELMTGF